MIEGLKPYAESAKSKPLTRTSAINIPWLTAIPEHWTVVRAKGLFTARTERARPDDEQLSATQAYGVIPQKEFERRVGRKVVQITQHLDKRAHVEPDDFVISMRSFQGGLERAWARGCIRSSYVVLKPSAETRVGYFAHLFKSLDYIRALQATGNFIRDGQDLSFKNFSLVDLPLPPLAEQADIAKCLDHANRKIDGFIRAKRKLIGLLNEQKQTIIHRAVTGKDEVRMMKDENGNSSFILQPSSLPKKPSGIPWLGDIPRHWEVLALKRVLRRLIDCEHKTAPAIDFSELRVVRTTGIRHGRLQFHGTYGTTPEAFKQWTRRGLPEAGDVLFTREAPAGEACVMPEGITLCMGQRTVLMKLRANRINAHFLVHSIYGGPPRTAITLASQGSTVGHFNMSDIGALTVFLPPRAEQVVIVEAIDRDTEPLNTAIARTEREIALMQEYRTRLTADIVTGKLDVREAAARLPDVPVGSAAVALEDLPESEVLEEPE